MIDLSLLDYGVKEEIQWGLGLKSHAVALGFHSVGRGH